MAKSLILRAKSATTKVTEVEYAHLETLASTDGVNLSEWIRGRLLREVRTNGDTNVLLSELLALRTILLNLLFSIANGERITAEQMQALVARGDAGKAVKAQKLLEAVKGVGTPGTEKGEGDQ
jgi:hypothetical protein